MITTPETISAQLHDGTFAGRWTLDPSASKVTLKTKAMFGVVPVKGTFGAVHGYATVGTTGEVSAEIVADATSLSTKMKKRDQHLRSADFFDTDTHPSMTVSITGVDAGLTATGTLTVKGNTVPLSFPLTVAEATDGRIVLDATFVVDRSEVGITFAKMGATKMLSTLFVHGVFTKS